MKANNYYYENVYIDNTMDSLKELSEDIFYAVQENLNNKYYDEDNAYELTNCYY